MALDTKEKRQNATGVGRPWLRDHFPVATPDIEWRVASGNAYGPYIVQTGDLTITVVDNGDNTGATVTITNAGASDSIEIYAANWDGTFAAATFTLEGSRTGDGTVVIAVAAGFYWVYAENVTDPEVSDVVGVAVTTGADDLWTQILDAVVAKIQALSLTGVTASDILKQKLPWNTGTFPPREIGVFVTPVAEQINAQYNTKERFGYGVQVTAFQDSNGDQTTNLNRLLGWRNSISAAFRMQLLTGVSEVHDTHVEPGPVIDPESFRGNFDAETLVLRFFTDKARGV